MAEQGTFVDSSAARQQAPRRRPVKTFEDALSKDVANENAGVLAMMRASIQGVKLT